jgi:cobyrinic acid a,c-diamide synthase
MPSAAPRLVLAAASSGAGKTTATVAIAAALRRRGLAVQPFKVGPDYLDPTWHALAAGRTSRNLDGWMMGREAALSTFSRAAAGADVSLVEGVMGLYDGASPRSDEGSTAELARWLGAPVVAVVDASGMARTLAAVVQGLAAFDPALRLAGVICNRIGSRSHLDLLREALAPFPVLGGLPDAEPLRIPERHLGLVTAPRAPLDDDALARWAALAEEWIDLDGLLAAARSAAPLPAAEPPPAAAERCRIGVAFDDAFHFYYDDNLARLEAFGARLVRFSPIRDAAPPDVDGLYLGGGYPELHAAALAANRPMRDGLRAFAAAGRPVYAECGGLMYLCRAIRTLDGAEHEMVGLLPGVARVRDRLQALGYAEVETTAPSCLGAPGLRLRGHQFRYSELDPAPEGMAHAYRVRRRRGGDPFDEGWGGGNLLASWVHVHWASCPEAAAGLVASCARARGAR